MPPRIQLVPLDRLTPAGYNPREADPARLDVLRLSLRKLGWLLPICALPDGEILSGHQRHAAAADLGYEQVPVAYLNVAGEQQRLALNVLSNRATNDMTRTDIARRLDAGDADELAARLPDVTPGTPESYPCLAAEPTPVADLPDPGSVDSYAARAAAILTTHVDLPVVCTDGRIVSGAARVAEARRTGRKTVPVVWIAADAADFADAALNRVTMDFDLDRIADRIRPNHSRALRGARHYLGAGHTFTVQSPSLASRRFDVRRPASLRKWTAIHGTRILEFGAGTLDETRLLRSLGVRVTAFEPYPEAKGRPADDPVDPDLAISLTRDFLTDVAAGVRWSSVFCQHVLNSVPFDQDRHHILTLLAALSWPDTPVYLVSRSRQDTAWIGARGREFPSHRGGSNFEAGDGLLVVGAFSRMIKTQKFYSLPEWRALLQPHFSDVSASITAGVVYGICKGGNVNADNLDRAIRFEFDLPYHGGRRMGLAAAAAYAFNARWAKLGEPWR